MERHGIPTARFAAFGQYEQARYLEQVDYPVVIKSSGLAAGKGVSARFPWPRPRLPCTRDGRPRLLGMPAHEVVIEERLEGEEVSLLAFSDGYDGLSHAPGTRS